MTDPAKVRGRIFRRRERAFDDFEVSSETTVGSLVKQFYPGEKVTCTYQGSLLSPMYSLRLYHFKDGDVIVATTDSEITEILPAHERRQTDAPTVRIRQFKFAPPVGRQRTGIRMAESLPVLGTLFVPPSSPD
jgi:hypothetical protein